MKRLLYIIIAFIFLANSGAVSAQAPGIQWQKCLGGTAMDEIQDVQLCSDGGYIMAGGAISNNGDVSGNHSIFGAYDAWVVKVDAWGIIQWQKCYGGSLDDYASSIKQTSDGGYIFTVSSISDDQQVPFNRGLTDIWIFKTDASGNIQWSKSFGGSRSDGGVSNGFGSLGRGRIADIESTSDGYIVATITSSNDGDVSGYHGVVRNDVWLLKLDFSGNLQWQKCLGGTGNDVLSGIVVTTDGGYMLAANTDSHDGDVSINNNATGSNCWIVKLDQSGNLLWEKCIGSTGFATVNDIQLTSDAGVIVGGMEYGDDGSNTASLDGWIAKLNSLGNLQWQNSFQYDYFLQIFSINQTGDGGYIVSAGNFPEIPFNPSDIDDCTLKGKFDAWIIKLTSTGAREWQKVYGGSNEDRVARIFPTIDGGYLFQGTTWSVNGDIAGNHGSADAWIVKLSFPGPAVSVIISSNSPVVCPGKEILFKAIPTNGGTAPYYQWKLNGINVDAGHADTALIRVLNASDIVTCEITSNACIDIATALSNSLPSPVDPSLGPTGFLETEATICSNSSSPVYTILQPSKVFPAYLWSNNSNLPSVRVDAPGQYWLQVTDSNGCVGRDSITVIPKPCNNSFYVPSAFSPNADGKNDKFNPVIFGNIINYRFTIYNRWGRVVFDSRITNKGWDGTFNGKAQEATVFIWNCTYQLEGEEIKSARGSVVLIR